MKQRGPALICFSLVAAVGTADAQPAPAPTDATSGAPTDKPAAAPPASGANTGKPGSAPPAGNGAPAAGSAPANAPASDAPASAAESAAPTPDAPAADAAPAAPAVDPAATGTVTGHITDSESEVGVAAASIRVLGGKAGEQTFTSELDGSFTLHLAPGNYTIEISSAELVTQTRSVTVADAPVTLDVTLAPVPRTGKAETIEVYGGLDTRKDSAVLAERRAAATVSDAVSAQQIARSPDSNGADVAKRMVAATVQDNRYIVIRGLGGRYSTTLLNGVPLPSPDPDVPAAPLDLFPASLITNLTVHKTFAPDMPGNFAGGALGIETRSYPTSFLLKIRVGLGSNTESSFRSINGQSGGSLDMLGFDDGARSLPSSITKDQLAGADGSDQLNRQIASFKNNWSLERGTVGPNLGLGATIGDTVDVGGNRLGYYGAVSYGHGYAQRKTHIARVGGDDGNGGRAPSVLQLDDEQGIEQANLSAVAGAGYKLAPGHKLDLFSMYVHTADASSSEVTGMDNSTAIVDRTRLAFLQRELMFTQLLGEHRLNDHAIVTWQGNVARVAQDEPDTRDLLRTQTPDGRWAISSSVGSSERLFGNLTDTTLGAAAGIRVPYERIKASAGASIQRSDRDYQVRRFHFNLLGDTPFLTPDQAFAPENAGSQMSMYEATQATDGYNATRSIAAAYAQADIDITSKLRAVAGARFERSHLDLGLDSQLTALTSGDMMRTERTDSDVLPSINAVYAFTPSSQLRAAYAMTVARANFREVAPALYYDYVRRRVIGGNPNLAETQIHNGDLRWETFLSNDEVLAASVFAKHFVKPIERTVQIAGDGDNVGFQNADSANTYGVELEARLSLARLTPALAAFSVGGNLSLIDSRIDLGDGAHRNLQGQSPYVANVSLGYEHKRLGTRVDLAYNAFGRRIEEVGTGGAGNVYEEPFHRLDLAVSQPLPRSLRLKLAAANLLNQRVVRTQDDVEILAYDVGVTVLGSVEFSLE